MSDAADDLDLEWEFACPNPDAWHRAFMVLNREWERSGRSNDSPPLPMILGGWDYTTTWMKGIAWHALLRWAADRGLSHLVPPVLPQDRITLETYTGSPDFWPYPFSEYANTTPRARPTAEEAGAALRLLEQRWSSIAGPELAALTRPLHLSGRKLRRLVVHAQYAVAPPWGSWDQLPALPARAAFTKLRASINAALAPHAVDHVDFVASPTPEFRGGLRRKRGFV